MRSTIKTFAAGLIAGAGLFASYGLIAQDYGEQSQEDVMKMFEELARPGPDHAELARMVGTWKHVNKHWMEPGAEPETSESVAECKSVLGGRFVVQSIKGEMSMGGASQPFEGLGVYGYDNFQKEPFFVWFDSMGTGYMVAKGTKDASGAITYLSECPTPMGTMSFKSVAHPIKNDASSFEMYMLGEDGTWFKNLEIKSTRVKGAGKGYGDR